MPTGPVVYLLHFSRSYRHARHYLGYTADLDRRLAQHRAGHGSPLVAAAIADGISFELAATWPGDRILERRLHRQKNSRARLCPICRAEARREIRPATGPRSTVPQDDAIVAQLAARSEPVTLPMLRSLLRRAGHDRVGSLHGRLELLARAGRVRKSELLGEIAWTRPA
jgi:hypothetical protein